MLWRPPRRSWCMHRILCTACNRNSTRSFERGHDGNILEEAYRGRYARQRLLNFWPESSCGYHAIKRFVCIIQVILHILLVLEQVIRAGVDALPRLFVESMPCGAAPDAGSHMGSAPLQNGQQAFRDPGFQFRSSFFMEIQTSLPDPLGHMNEIENNPRVIAFFVKPLAQDIQLRFVAVHQRDPSLVSFRIAPPGFAKGFLNDVLGRLFQTRPHAFVLRTWTTTTFLLVVRRQTSQNILGSPAVGLDGINGRDCRHAFGVALLATAEPTR